MWAIFCKEDTVVTDEPLYWNNEQGWVDEASATLFEHNDYNLPLDGAWVEVKGTCCECNFLIRKETIGGIDWFQTDKGMVCLDCGASKCEDCEHAEQEECEGCPAGIFTSIPD